jgi:uncharacterized membrane protein
MQQIGLTLKNTKLRSYHRFSWFIVFLNMAAQLFLVSTPAYSNSIYLVAGVAAIILVLTLVAVRGHAARAKTQYIIGILYTALSVTWITWALYWAVAILVLFYLLYLVAIRRFDVSFSENHISYPSFPRKEIPWNELNNVIMKDGILTIDFKTNKIIQAETEGNTVNEKEFNEFCKRHLQ